MTPPGPASHFIMLRNRDDLPPRTSTSIFATPMSTWVPSSIRPLALRIPILMITLLALSLATMSWIAYEGIHDFAKQVEKSRLDVSTSQLVSSFEGSVGGLRQEASHVAALPAITAALSPAATEAQLRAARRTLGQYRKTSVQFLSVALWSADGSLVVADGSGGTASSLRPSSGAVPAVRDSSAVIVSRLTPRSDTILYTATAPVYGPDSAPAGYLVITRRVASAAEGAGLYGRLIGPSARILFGNQGESRSLDLARSSPTASLPAVDGVGEYMAEDGVGRYYSRAGVPGTPWVVVVDQPFSLSIVPARKFALGLLAVAGLFTALAAALVWLIIRRSLQPLEKVTQAVRGYADADSGREGPVGGEDEIAQFGRAYNAMVDKVASRTDALLDSIHEHQESEARYRLLIDHLPDGIMVHRNREIAFVNPACARLFGEDDARALIGRSILDFVEPSEHDLTLERLGQVDVGDSVPTREMRLRRVDGKRVVVESTNMALNLDGEMAIQTILHDVTARHALEDRLHQSQKMEAVGRLAGGIAHDFNNILTVIDAHAEFALREDGDPAERTADIEEIRRASGSAARLTRQLLAFSRKQAVSPARIDLSDAVRDVLVMLNRVIGDNVQLEANLGEDLWAVFADPNQVEQVLLNLALNARDAMPAGGRLAFSTANVTLGPDSQTATGEQIPEGEYVVLRVEDTGVGMSPEVASKAFEPFFTTKEAGRGTGLGLATVYGIVKQSNGYIWLYSEAGRGSVFKIMLPRYGGAAVAAPAPRVSDQRMTAVAGHVLVVEDQPYVRAAIKRSLAKAGFIVTDVGDAESALELMRSGSAFDLILTDMVMPGQSGADLALQVSVTHPGLPCIIMSGYSEAMTDRQWRLPPNSRFLEKPVSPSTLLRVMSEMLPVTGAPDLVTLG